VDTEEVAAIETDERCAPARTGRRARWLAYAEIADLFAGAADPDWQADRDSVRG
jgi:hypothetical protein